MTSTTIGDSPTGMALQSDSKIVTVGSRGEFLVARFDVDGTLDDSFGSGGIVTTPVPDSPGSVVLTALLSSPTTRRSSWPAEPGPMSPSHATNPTAER